MFILNCGRWKAFRESGLTLAFGVLLVTLPGNVASDRAHASSYRHFLLLRAAQHVRRVVFLYDSARVRVLEWRELIV